MVSHLSPATSQREGAPEKARVREGTRAMWEPVRGDSMVVLPLWCLKPPRPFARWPLLVFSSGLNPIGGSASGLSFSFLLEAALASWSRNVAMTPPPRLGDRTAALGVASLTTGAWAVTFAFRHSSVCFALTSDSDRISQAVWLVLDPKGWQLC